MRKLVGCGIGGDICLNKGGGGGVRWWCTVRLVVLFEVDGGGK